ncbi:flagellar motor/biogenesis protein FlaJ [Natronomonas pharaonis DSM 2160]|uniref:Flagellar motor/biogenesis protein FlaJ n=1 Tax=Natronomonas pharaonis (strain ATCC 35678 / DSM 2160 / CIP 103997 / JCM 8858 / NBRC 14720 / NCIMB 2260 / Gabara) TaxID=348780 RepID=A0A1U7EVT6_NATPD|nr:archaellar assembly protein FlaJ [Natronomonas pharaonis]CAI49171.1 flagellar motor/biogenesis protein FlaJ [Natronomonas pharaonis DSM 2160]
MGVAERSAQLTDLVGSILDAYDRMEMDAKTYVLAVLLPTTVLFLGSIVLALVWQTILLVRLLFPLLGAVLLGAGVAYPKLAMDQRRIEMENRFHLLVTHMTVLSTTNIDRMEVFRKLSKEEEYGELTVEMRRIVQLVDTWNQSLDDALRRRAKEVPSDSLTDLFDRLAYTLGAGQEMSDFLFEEQGVMIENYKTIYQQSLENLDVMKDLYLSMVLSMTFALVFAVVLPILTATNPTWTVAAVIAMFVFVQVGFFLVIRALVPHDPLWYIEEGYRTRSKQKLVGSSVLAVVLFLLIVLVMTASSFGVAPFDSLVPMASIPTPLYLAIPTLPFLIPAIVFRRQEKAIIERDEEFPSFIRALGASESAKQSTTSTVLKTLRKKDFGALTPNVDDLYRRLNMRINTERAWRYFAEDTNSYIIQKFSEMYLIGRSMGGNPKMLGELISENMNELCQLREQRRQVTVTLIGLLYGISAASAFAFFTGLEIAIIMAGFDLEMGTAQFDFGQLLHTEMYNVPLLRYLLLLVILFNAVMSALTIRVADGGHYGNAFLHFVALVWVGCMTAFATESLISMLLDIDL